MPTPDETRTTNDVILQERPYLAQVIQTQVLNDIAGILYEQLAVMKDGFPDLVKKYQFDITDEIMELNADKIPSMPWISLTLHNDGKDPIHVFVNEMGTEESYNVDPAPTDPTVGAGDSFNVDMKASKIKKLIMYCEHGKTATVRIFAAMKEYRAKPRDEVVIE